MSMSLPGAPGISMVRRSMLRDGRTSRHPTPPPRKARPAVPPNGGRLGELADALSQVQEATGLDGRDIASRLVEHLDPASPVRAIDVFASGRADLVAAYLTGELDGAAVLRAWRPADG